MSTWSDRGLPVITLSINDYNEYVADAEMVTAHEQIALFSSRDLNDVLSQPIDSEKRISKWFHHTIRPALSILQNGQFTRRFVDSPSAALWLDFQGPIGLLPALPWESALQQLFGAPVYRLPRHEILPVARTQSLSATLYLDLDTASRLPPDATPYMRLLREWSDPSSVNRLQELLASIQACGDKAAINVIGRPEIINRFTADTDASAEQALTSPEHTFSTHTLDLEMPWSVQVQSVQPNAPVDILIIAAQAIVNDDQASLLISRTENDKRIAVPPEEIAACATSLGAWSTALLIPGWEGRMVAHQLAAARPGPVITAASTRGISRMYRRLLGGQQNFDPALDATAVYVHPHGASTYAPIVDPSAESQLPRIRSVLEDFTLGETAAAQDAPRWLASNQRVLEQFAEPLLQPAPDDEISVARREGYAAGMATVSSVLTNAYEAEEEPEEP